VGLPRFVRVFTLEWTIQPRSHCRREQDNCDDNSEHSDRYSDKSKDILLGPCGVRGCRDGLRWWEGCGLARHEVGIDQEVEDERSHVRRNSMHSRVGCIVLEWCFDGARVWCLVDL